MDNKYLQEGKKKSKEDLMKGITILREYLSRPLRIFIIKKGIKIRIRAEREREREREREEYSEKKKVG